MGNIMRNKQDTNLTRMAAQIWKNVGSIRSLWAAVAGGGGGGGTVDSVVGGTDITVDATDPANPIVSLDGRLSPTTTLGDIIFNGGGGDVRYGIGKLGNVLTSDGNVPQWEATEYHLSFAFGGEDEDLAVGTSAITFQMPNFATKLIGVSVNVKTAPTGSVAQFDLNEGGVSVLSTKITIDTGELTSVNALTQPVISDNEIGANAIITLDVDAIGSTTPGVGGKAWVYYKKA